MNTKRKLVIKQDFKDIENILWNMECTLRNKEGITGINALYHINLMLIIRILDNNYCNKFSIPIKFSFKNLNKLDSEELYNIIVEKDTGLLHYIYNENRFGFTKDIPFEIKKHSTLHCLFIKSKQIFVNNILKNTDIIGNIYENFLKKETKTMSGLQQYFTDRNIVNYMIKLTNPKVIDGKIETFYDGAAGTGGFVTQYISYLNSKNKNINWETNKYNIFANELNKCTFSLLKLNLFFSTNYILENIFLNDTLVNDNSMDDGYDIILMNPPFAVKGLKYTDMNDKIKSLNINATHGILLFLQNSMKNLAKNGRCAFIVPEGFLYNSNKMYRETRKYLLNNFELKKIIKLGKGSFFRNTSCKVSILYFENNGRKTDNIDYLEIELVNNLINETFKFNININDIISHNYSLNINLFKQTNINTNYDVFTLNELCFIKNGKNISKQNRKGTIYPYYGSNGISGYVDEFLYDGEYLLHGDQGSIINSIKFVNTKFYPSNHTIVFKPNDPSKVNIKYLYYFIKLQVNINEITSGTVIPEIRKEDFKNIKIILPNIEIQTNLVYQLQKLNEQLTINLDLPKEILLQNMNDFISEIELKGKELLKSLYI